MTLIHSTRKRVAALCVSIVACTVALSPAHAAHHESHEQQTMNIVETADAAGSFATLIAAA